VYLLTESGTRKMGEDHVSLEVPKTK